MGYLQIRVLPYTNSQSVQEVHAFSCPGSDLPVQRTTLWPVHSTHGGHGGGQRGQTDGVTEGYKDPLVPRRLVGQSQVPPYLSPAYTDFGSSLWRTRLAGEQGEIRTGSKTVFNFISYQFDLKRGTVRPTSDRLQALTSKIQTILSPSRCARSGSSCPSYVFSQQQKNKST